MAYSQSSLSSNRPYSVNSFERKLILFNSYIEEITLKESEESPEERRQQILENLRFDQFSERIRSIFGTDIKTNYIKNVFKKISSNPDASVDWSELFGYDNSLNIAITNNNTNDQNDGNKQELNSIDEIQVFMMSFKFRVGDSSGDKARRDIIQAINYASEIDCFITAAQKGAISVWNNKLKLQACALLNDQVDGWVNGCCYMPNIKRVAIASERSLTFWDFRSKKATKNSSGMNLFAIQPIIEPLTCIDNATDHKKDYDRIIFCDSDGYVMCLKLNLNDLASNNTKPDILNDDRRILQLQNLKNSYIKRKIHDEAVIRIKYINELDSYISCSASSKQSLAIEEMDKFELKETRATRYISINKGVNAFCYCSKAHLIATGGFDKIIRLYNPLVLNKPTGKLVGHVFTITDLVCNEKDQQLISLSSERVFRVWDLSTLKCIQVFSDTEERPGDKRIYSILFDERRERLLTGSSSLDCWPLTRSVQDTMQLPHTHDKPLIACVYNSYINQIATLCLSDLKVWEAETGRLMYSVSEIHGKNIEVTCMTLDPSGYRLATGGSDGSIKIWDFGAGQELKHRKGRKSREDLSIIKLLYSKINDELYLIAVGWNNKIRLYYDTMESNDIAFIKSFDDQVQFSDDLINLSKYNTMRPESNQAITKKRQSIVTATTSDRTIPTPESRYTGNQTVLSNYDNLQIDDPQPLLRFHEIQTIEFNPETNLLISGGTSSELVFWDRQKRCIDKISKFPTEYTPTSQVKRGLKEGHSLTPSGAEHLRKINCIKILIHKTRKYEVILPKEPSNLQKDSSSRPNSRLKINRYKSNTELTIKVKQDQDASFQTVNSELTKIGSRAPSQISRGSHRVSKLEKRNYNENIEVVKPKAITRFVDVSYSPIIATGHDDSTLRLWNEEGELLHELISPAGSITGAACTAICTDPDANYLYTADSRGYVTMWSIAEYIENLEASQHTLESKEKNKNTITMLVCWKAHTSRVNDLIYISVNKTLITISFDESARIWWGTRGRYIGFLGQIKPITIPLDDLSDWSPPYDISEPPIYSTVKVVAEKQELNKNYQYPLIIDKNKFSEPLVLPQIESAMNNVVDSTTLQNKKFYSALIKPKHSFNSSEIITTSPRKDGSVYATLPLYEEKKSDDYDLKLMLLSNPFRKSKELSYLTFNRIINKPKKESDLVKLSSKRSINYPYKPINTAQSMSVLSNASSRLSNYRGSIQSRLFQ